MKLALTLVFLTLLGITGFWFQTDGFTVVTAEAARRASIAQDSPVLPDAQLLTSTGNTTALLSNLGDDGRIAIVSFMYTRCPFVCATMGAEFQRLQAQVQTLGLEKKVRLISISFDPADTSQWLARYQQRMGAHPSIWQAVLAQNESQRSALLAAFGIVVIPAPLGQYEHNAAYHIVTPDGRLRRIVDLDDTAFLLPVVNAYAAQADTKTPKVSAYADAS